MNFAIESMTSAGVCVCVYARNALISSAGQAALRHVQSDRNFHLYQLPHSDLINGWVGEKQKNDLILKFRTPFASTKWAKEKLRAEKLKSVENDADNREKERKRDRERERDPRERKRGKTREQERGRHGNASSRRCYKRHRA